MILVEAGHALQFSRDAADVQGRAFSQSAFGYAIPGKSNGLIRHIYEFTDHEMNTFYAQPAGAAQDIIENGLYGRELCSHGFWLYFTLL
jgi:hypothetical protein